MEEWIETTRAFEKLSSYGEHASSPTQSSIELVGSPWVNAMGYMERKEPQNLQELSSSAGICLGRDHPEHPRNNLGREMAS